MTLWQPGPQIDGSVSYDSEDHTLYIEFTDLDGKRHNIGAPIQDIIDGCDVDDLIRDLQMSAAGMPLDDEE